MPMKVRYTSVDGEILAEKRAGIERTYVPDPLGSTRVLLDNTQTITDRFSYWPYGEERIRTGTSPTALRFVGTRGYYRDQPQRTYIRARHYSPDRPGFVSRAGMTDVRGPAASVFLSEDAYAYARNNPILYVDPDGLQPRPPAGTPPGRIFTCIQVRRCLSGATSNPCSCPNPKMPSMELMLCLFWQESNFGVKGVVVGNLGTMTDIALKQMRTWGCNPHNYRRATGVGRPFAGAGWCEMVKMAAYYLGCVGLSGYNRDYGRGTFPERFDCCEKCLQDPLVRMKEADPCAYCFLVMHA